MHALTKPKYFMPVHGEYRHLICHKELAEGMGMSADRIFVSDIGRVVEISDEGAKFNGTVPAGKVLIDGSGIGDVGKNQILPGDITEIDRVIVILTAENGRSGFSDPFARCCGIGKCIRSGQIDHDPVDCGRCQ